MVKFDQFSIFYNIEYRPIQILGYQIETYSSSPRMFHILIVSHSIKETNVLSPNSQFCLKSSSPAVCMRSINVFKMAIMSITKSHPCAGFNLASIKQLQCLCQTCNQLARQPSLQNNGDTINLIVSQNPLFILCFFFYCGYLAGNYNSVKNLIKLPNYSPNLY